MIYFCADDYGISNESNNRIENCLKNSVLNKVSVLPNAEISDFKNNLSFEDKTLSLHINLVEGKPLSKPDSIPSLINESGCFKSSFIGLFFKSFLPCRKKFEKEIYSELKNQIKFWKGAMGSNDIPAIDSHQHVHMIPLIFKTLMRVIKEEGIAVHYVRIPAEPVMPYLLTPSLYFDYTITGIIKQWLLIVLSIINKKEFKKSGISTGYFMGIMFSGNLSEKNICKLLPHYLKLAEKKGKDIEITFHPGYLEESELTFENRKSFEKFYLSSQRKREYDSLMNLKL